ncbi:HEPN domain-containing protein [Thermococcus sp. 9N3]|uniref:HEPN domain-containing protein n=1 Tax=Thermococcus sp. 9N3 TaxID=163002 RepID=UPI001431AEA8|nr:HEPN domain-containing protein [Thermococcus sp. 9N3]NJE48881.1 HEPN domain-containing protein [Thermococcus sp. 9N3]
MVTEVEILLNDAHESLEAARVLLENGFYRDAISRAYYAMFYAASALLRAKGVVTKSHRGVIAKFGLEFVNTGIVEKYYAKALSLAETSRERADYDPTYRPSEEEAESIIEDAERFIERVEKALEELK